MLRILMMLSLLFGAVTAIQYAMPGDDGIAYARSHGGGGGGGSDSDDSDRNEEDSLHWVDHCRSGGPDCGLEIRTDTPRDECPEGESERDCCARLGGPEYCACEGPPDRPEVCYGLGFVILVVVSQPNGQEESRYFRCDLPPPDDDVPFAWLVEQNCIPTASGEDYEATVQTLTFEPGETSDIPRSGWFSGQQVQN